MSFSDVQSGLRFQGYEGAADEKQRILDALEYLYANSATARTTLDKISSSNLLSIYHDLGKFEADDNQIRIDETQVTTWKYFDFDGQLRAPSLAEGLIHEIIHAMDGLGDLEGVDLAASSADFLGATVLKTNQVMTDLGMSTNLRSGYYGTVLSGSPFLNATFNNRIDFSFVENTKVPIGLSRPNDGRDFLMIMTSTTSDNVQYGGVVTSSTRETGTMS